MQAVKEKLNDMNAMRKAKAEAKAEEKAEKELAKVRVEVAHEVRMAKEAEAAMDLHVAKAGQKVEKEIAKHTPHLTHEAADGRNNEHHGHHRDDFGTTAMGTDCPNNTADAAAMETNFPTNRAGAPPAGNLL